MDVDVDVKELLNKYFELDRSETQIFYLQHLMKWSSRILKDRIRRAQEEGMMGRYKTLFQTVGDSAAPLVLTIRALEPQ